MRKGFTLVEVNLAIFIMAVGVLTMCGLYALGYRENRQSVEDVASVSFADTYLAPLVQGLSALDMKWSDWCTIGNPPSRSEMRSRGIADGLLPREGWMAYVDKVKLSGEDEYGYRVRTGARERADSAFGDVISKVPAAYRGTRAAIPGDYEYALVVTRRGAVIQLAFRCARRRDSLMSQPAVVAEVHFQGDPNQ